MTSMNDGYAIPRSQTYLYSRTGIFTDWTQRLQELTALSH